MRGESFMKIIYTFFTIVSLFISSELSFTQWSTDPAENSQISNGGIVAGAVIDGEGGAIIASFKHYNQPQGHDLFIQRIDSSGYLKWNPDGILISAARYDQYYAPHDVDNMRCILSDGAGGAYFSYIDYQRSALLDWLRDSCDVFVQHIDKDGNLLWGDVGIQLNPKGISGEMFALIPDGMENIIVVWMDTRASDDHSTFGAYLEYAQKINYWGNFLWQENGIPVNTIRYSLYDVASDGKGGLYIDTSYFLSRWNTLGEEIWKIPTIWAQKLSDDGLGGVFEISHYHDSLWVNHTDSIGFRKWGDKEGIVLATDVDYVFAHNIRMVDRNGGIYLGWYNRSDFLILQHLSGSGELLFGANGLPGGRIGVSNGIGGIIISRDWWDTDRHFAQNLDSFGNALWGAADVLYSSRPNFERLFAVSDGKGGAIFIWSGFTPNRGILYQRINKYGQLGGLTTRITDSPSLSTADFLLCQNYPNPFNERTIIRYQLYQVTAHLTNLIIYDIRGKAVRTLVDEFQTRGNHKVVWNGKNNEGIDVASGIYFYQLKTNGFIQAKKLTLIR